MANGNEPAKTEKLCRDEGNVPWAEHEVSVPKAPRLGLEPEEPLKAAFLHPGRGLTRRTCVKIEGSPDREYRHGERVTVFVGPNFLSRTTQTHKSDGRLRFVDPFDNF